MAKRTKPQPATDATTRAAIADLRSRSPFRKKKTGESKNTSTFGVIGAKGAAGKRKPPTFVVGTQARAEEKAVESGE